MSKTNLEDLTPQKYPKLRQNCQTSKFCWFNVGGTAQWCYKPSSIEELQSFIKEFAHKLPIYVVGAGSNVIFPDGELKGAVLRLGKEFNYIHESTYKNSQILQVGAATLDFSLALYSRENSIAGLEFFAGIPGTIGGAIAMNAGAYGTETKDVLLHCKAINLKTGEIRILERSEIEFSYRYNPLTEAWLFLEGFFRMQPGNKEEIATKIRRIQQEREQTQPVKTKTGGSTFKNPEGEKAWKLIEESGCRGLRINGCCISELHCNFIVNDGGATASDIIQLMDTVQKKVAKKTGIILQPEIKIVGNT